MKQVNIHYAKTHLSRLLEEASRGEEVVIAKAGKPYARLVPMNAREVRAAKRRQSYGILWKTHPEFAKAIAANPDVFFEPMSEDELRLWEGDGSDFDITP